MDAEQAVWEASPQCGDGAEAPTPQHGLAATCLDDEGRPGNGLLLDLTSADDAGRFAGDYRASPRIRGSPGCRSADVA